MPSAASYKATFNIVQMLLDKVALIINAQGGEYRLMPSRPLRGGYLDIVQILIEEC